VSVEHQLIKLILVLCPILGSSFLQAQETSPSATQKNSFGLPIIPTKIPQPSPDGIIYVNDLHGVPQATTIEPRLQNHLSAFLIDARSPIAAVVIADVKTGNILAMAQGKDPESWGSKTHTALHTGFPAASVFKTVVTTAALEIAQWDPLTNYELQGGCSRVGESGAWMMDGVSRYGRNDMSLRRAFGVSCNGFYAKIAVNNLGIGAVNQFAHKLGWQQAPRADFMTDKSPFHPPSHKSSSASTVGRFAAGFGHVGLSAIHAAQMMLTIAHRGHTMPLRIFRSSPLPTPEAQSIYSENTSERLLNILDASVMGGTASFAFRRGKYAKIRGLVGGKTGTLTGSNPKGLTTWFAGLAPVDQPEVVVASVVMLDGRWIVKGPSLAAEAFWAYFDAAGMEASRKDRKFDRTSPRKKTVFSFNGNQKATKSIH
jgi:peptidoglycan glycosyltransferase